MTDIDTSALQRFTTRSNPHGLGYSDGIIPDDAGEFVAYKDYMAITAQLTEARAQVAAAYEAAASSLEDRGSDGWAENVMAEYASVNADAIRAGEGK